MDKFKKVGTKKMQDAYNKAFDESPVVDRVKNPLRQSEKVGLTDEMAKEALTPKPPKSKFFRETSYVDIPDLPVGAADDLVKAEKIAEKSGILNKFGKLAKGLGLGAAAIGAFGAGQKAMAGDYGGAAVDLGQMVIPDEIQIGSAGEGSDKPSSAEPYDFSENMSGDQSILEKYYPRKFDNNPSLDKRDSLKKLKTRLGY